MFLSQKACSYFFVRLTIPLLLLNYSAYAIYPFVKRLFRNPVWSANFDNPERFLGFIHAFDVCIDFCSANSQKLLYLFNCVYLSGYPVISLIHTTLSFPVFKGNMKENIRFKFSVFYRLISKPLPSSVFININMRYSSGSKDAQL